MKRKGKRGKEKGEGVAERLVQNKRLNTERSCTQTATKWRITQEKLFLFNTRGKATILTPSH